MKEEKLMEYIPALRNLSTGDERVDVAILVFIMIQLVLALFVFRYFSQLEQEQKSTDISHKKSILSRLTFIEQAVEGMKTSMRQDQEVFSQQLQWLQQDIVRLDYAVNEELQAQKREKKSRELSF